MVAKVKKYLQSMSPAAKASFWFVVSNVMMKGISFITTPIFTRILSQADYGATSVFVSWESVISIFATLSLAGGVYNVAMTKYEDDIEKYTSSMIGLSMVSSSFVYAICIGLNLLFPQLFNLSTAYLLFMWIQTFTNACTSFWLMRKRFNYKYKSVIAYTFANALLGPIIAIIAIYLFPDNKAIAKVIGAGVIGIVIGVVICVNSLVKGKKIFDKNYWIYALKFNIPLLPHYLSSVLLTSASKLMINGMIGEAQAGIFSISHSITGVVSLITQAINTSLIPYTLKAIKSGDYKGLKRTTTGCTMMIAFVCVGIMLFSREGILIFSTEEYLPAIAFVAPLSFSVLVEFLSGIIGNIVFYYEKTGFMSVATMISAVANIALNFVLITMFGPVAAAYTTLITSILKFVLYYLGARKYEKNIKEIVDIKSLVVIFAVYVAFMVYALVFAYNLVMRIALVAVLCLAVVIMRKKIIAILKSMKSKPNGDVANEE